MTLGDCRPGSVVRLSGLPRELTSRRRLAHLGFVPGAQLRLISRGPAGGIIVAVDEARVALDARTAAAVAVAPLR